MDVIFTIVSRNYAAQAKTLMQSLAAAEPTARRVVIATDGAIPELAGLAEVIDATALDAPVAAMSVYYDALELNTAVKPATFRRLFETSETVTYLDPDIYVFQPLGAVRQALAQAELALIPHLTRPLLGEAEPNDRTILNSGVWNLGFMAARRTEKVLALIDWWDGRCRFDARVDFEGGLFTDQRWMDLAPGFVDGFAALRDPGLDLAYWSLDGRTLAKGRDGWTVDGAPLTFFHYSGFDPDRPDVLSKHQDRIRVTPGSPLAELLADYAKALKANGHDRARSAPYAHGRFPSGAPVTAEQRRRALAAARAGEDFSGGLTDTIEARLSGAADGVRREPDAANWREPAWRGAACEAPGWLRGEGPDGTPRALMALLAARGDLRARFADDPEGLLAWALGVEAPAERFAPDLLPDAVLSALAADPARLAKAARFAAPDAPELKARISAAFGLSARGRWPEPLVRALRAPLCAPQAGRAQPHIRLFEEIWASRADLQRQFPLRSGIDRLRFLRWLIGGGLAEYDVPLETLPPQVLRHPLTALASLSLGRGATSAPRAGPKAAELWIVESAEEAREAAADRLVYEAATGRFLGPTGTVAAPSEVAEARFLTDPALVAADAMALHAKGVRWARAVGAWNAQALAALDDQSVALGFVDEVEGEAPSGLFRPARSRQMVAA